MIAHSSIPVVLICDTLSGTFPLSDALLALMNTYLCFSSFFFLFLGFGGVNAKEWKERKKDKELEEGHIHRETHCSCEEYIQCPLLLHVIKLFPTYSSWPCLINIYIHIYGRTVEKGMRS